MVLVVGPSQAVRWPIAIDRVAAGQGAAGSPEFAVPEP